MDKTFINSCNKLAVANNKPFSKEMHTILQQEWPQEEHEMGHKIFALGTNSKHMSVRGKVLLKLDELDALLTKVNQ